MGGERVEQRCLSGTASLLKEVLPRLAALWSRSLSLNPSFLIHCHSSAASRQNKRLRYQFSTRAILSISRVVHYEYLRELAAFLSCQHSRQDSSCMAATPTLLTRCSRQCDASRARNRTYIYVRKDGCVHT